MIRHNRGFAQQQHERGYARYPTKDDQMLPVYVSEAQLQSMISRFLSWKLPKDFAPDCGITFKRTEHGFDPALWAHFYEPTGTNLFHAEQAKAMILHLLGHDEPVLALPAPKDPEAGLTPEQRFDQRDAG